MHKYYCVGHQAPTFTPTVDYIHISASPFPGLKQLLIADDELGADFHGSILSEYTQLFGLADRLRNASPDGRFYMFQYRKFLSFEQGGRLTDNMPYARACSASEANALFPSPDQTFSMSQDLLIGPAANVASLAVQYGKHHHAEDFAAFLISLSSVDGFDEMRCSNFKNCPFLIPAPSLGINRFDIFLRHMDILRSAWAHFAKHFLTKRQGYQRRVGGFLLERLHSFLLYEEITLKRVTARNGYQIIISDSPKVEHTI